MDSSDLRDGEATLFSEIKNLADVSRRDGEVNYYFASVLEEVLEAVDSIENDAESSRNKEEAEIVEGFELALDETVSVVNDALTTKRAVDLFSACNDLDEVNRGWQRSIEPVQIFRFIEKDLSSQRGEVLEIYRELDDINPATAFNEPAPFKSMKEEVRVWMRDNGGGNQKNSKYYSGAVVFISKVLYIALKDLMDKEKQPAVNKRLQRTVY